MRDSKRDTDVKNRLLNSVGEEEGGMIWENGIETCILSCKKRITRLFPCPGYYKQCCDGRMGILTCILSCKKGIASLGSIQDTGCLGLTRWDDLEG